MTEENNVIFREVQRFQLIVCSLMQRFFNRKTAQKISEDLTNKGIIKAE